MRASFTVSGMFMSARVRAWMSRGGGLCSVVVLVRSVGDSALEAVLTFPFVWESSGAGEVEERPGAATTVRLAGYTDDKATLSSRLLSLVRFRSRAAFASSWPELSMQSHVSWQGATYLIREDHKSSALALAPWISEYPHTLHFAILGKDLSDLVFGCTPVYVRDVHFSALVQRASPILLMCRIRDLH